MLFPCNGCCENNASMNVEEEISFLGVDLIFFVYIQKTDFWDTVTI